MCGAVKMVPDTHSVCIPSLRSKRARACTMVWREVRYRLIKILMFQMGHVTGTKKLKRKTIFSVPI